jgi:plasmid stabilization system protein ParE
MKVQLAPEAEADLLESLDVVRERNPAAAERLARKVFSTLKRLARGDFEGPEQRLTTGEIVRGGAFRHFEFTTSVVRTLSR